MPQETIQSGFESIRRNKVYEEVARQLERMILKKLHPGDKLPSERELAETLGVSRSSIRDAIRSLELIGLVEPRQGSGTVVREISADTVMNPLTSVLRHKVELVTELIDFRKMLEPPLAARAAIHATSEELEEMDEILRRQETKFRGRQLAIEEDSEFHYAIAMASGNTVVLKMLDVLMDLLRDTRERSLQTEGRPQKSLAGHKKVLLAIKKRDAEGAKAAMRRHIEDIEEIVLNESE